MNIRGYKLVVANGPATGWGYTTSVPPDEVIGIAPMPEDVGTGHGRWMRVPVDSPPELDWPETRLYQREPLPTSVRDDWLTNEGDLIVQYKVVEL